MSVMREIIALFSIKVDDKEVKKGEDVVQRFSKGLLEVGKGVVAAFAVDKVIDFGREIINQADEVKKAGDALGIVPQHLIQLQYAASGAGVGVDELRGSLARLNMVAANAAQGGGQAEAFKKLGVSLKNSDGTLKTSGQLFEEVGIAIADIQNPTERAGVASDIFGKSYAKLLPLFAQGGEGLAKLKKQASDLGIVFDDAFIKDAGEFNDNMGALKAGFTGFMVQALGPLLPMLVEFAKASVDVAKSLVRFAKSTRLLQTALFLLAGSGMSRLIVKGLAMVSKGGGWIKFFEKLRMQILRTILPFLVIEDILIFLTGGKSVTGDLFDKILGKGATKKVQETVQALLNAPNKIGVAWGGLLLALDIVWTETKFGFLLAAQSIEDAFTSAWNGIIEGAQGMLKSMLEITSRMPGMTGISAGLSGAVEGLEGFKIQPGGGADALVAERQKERTRIAAKGDALALMAKPPEEPVETVPAGPGGKGLKEKKTGVRLGTTVAPTVRMGTTTVSAPKKQAVAKRTALDAKITAAVAPASATANVPAPMQSTTNVNAPANVVQNFNVQGNIDQGTVPTLRKSMKAGATDALNMRAAQASLVQQGG